MARSMNERKSRVLDQVVNYPGSRESEIATRMGLGSGNPTVKKSLFDLRTLGFTILYERGKYRIWYPTAKGIALNNIRAIQKAELIRNF